MAKGITGSRCQPARGPVGGERTAYCLPARAPVGGHRTAASQTILRIPKATLEILSAYGEDPFRAIFGLELDCGKLWRGGITGSRCQPARGPVGGERTAYCLPARAPVGGHRTAASQTSFTESESDVTDSAGVRGGPLCASALLSPHSCYTSIPLNLPP